MTSLRMALAAFAACLALPAHPSRLPAASRAQMSGAVGAHRLTFPVTVVAGSAALRVRPTATAYVAITEVHPASPRPVPYHYLVTGAGIEPFERVYGSRGFGPVTYFVRVTGRAVSTISIRNLAGPRVPPRFLSVRGVSAADVRRARASDHFTLMGTAINARSPQAADDMAARLSTELPTAPERRIGRALSCEIYYACRDEASVRAQLVQARTWARLNRVRVLLGLVSWWAGTPLRVPDGLGGAFGDVKYQQICYTPGAEHPENPAIRQLLGARYNRHYRLSVPNIWSNTPWLTMNSRVLNEYRERRLGDAARLLKEVSGGDLSWVAGVFLENEPRYWDTQSTQGTPQWAGEQWADFNPLAVEQAARDGVTLDPGDGMSPAELAWLQMNVGRYFQQTVDAAGRALQGQGLLGRFPLFTHSLQIGVLFPCSLMNQSPADWARTAGASTGIEGIWSNLSDYDRVREWGPWCNLNREETDGLPIDTHLWDLRTTYAAGGEFYNSYNWHLIADKAYFRYAAEFIKGLPAVRASFARAERVSPDALSVVAPQSLQACGSIAVSVSAGARPVRVALEVSSGADRSWFSERREWAGAGTREIGFVFPVPAEVSWQTASTMRLHAYGGAGEELPGAATFAAGAEPPALRLDLDESRALSRLVIGWGRGATSRSTTRPGNRPR